MSISSKRVIAGMVLGGLVTVSAAVAPATAQGLSVVAPTNPTWARWLGLETGREFVLGGREGESRSPTPRNLSACASA